MIYLDNAATSFPKPSPVWREQLRCMRTYCGNSGRSSHRMAMKAAEKIYECREEIASFFGSSHPERVVFTPNATVALNTVIKGILKSGDHVLISDLEHNAVWRPVCRMAREQGVQFDIFPTDADNPMRTAGGVCRELEQRIRPNTRMVLCTHASNICPLTLPIAKIGELCRKRGILFAVDASQSAGHLHIDTEKMYIDALCAPGHKGLMGVQGSGFLLLGEGVSVDPLTEGGNGVHSLESGMPSELPERLEAGTLPTPAIAGLCEGIRWVKSVGVEAISEQETQWNELLKDRLKSLHGVKILAEYSKGSILSFYSELIPSELIGTALDTEGICVRSGFHCAALAHRTLHTPKGGAVRISPSPFNRKKEADQVWKILKDLF